MTHVVSDRILATLFARRSLAMIKTFLFAASLLLTVSAQACTIWAATGPKTTLEGDTIVAKVRDYVPNEQVEVTVDDGHGYRYRGLTSDGGKLRMAINEKGLAVVFAMASCIPNETLATYPKFKSDKGYGILETLTRECASVEEALKRIPTLHEKHPIHILIGDKKAIALIEITPKGSLHVRKTTDGTLAHTNHFVAKKNRPFNVKIAKSSLTRYKRITELLKTEPRPLTFDANIALTKDRHDGPNNSIFRTGNSYLSSRTLSIMVMRIPKTGQPEIYLTYQENPDLEDDPWITKRETLVFNK